MRGQFSKFRRADHTRTALRSRRSRGHSSAPKSSETAGFREFGKVWLPEPTLNLQQSDEQSGGVADFFERRQHGEGDSLRRDSPCGNILSRLRAIAGIGWRQG